MQIFLDTADVAEIRRAAEAGLIDGVTTNPSLMRKAGGDREPREVFRVDDISGDGMELIGQIRQIYDGYGLETGILAASIRHPRHAVECMLLGADCATLPPSILWQLLHHPLTDAGLERFLEDWKALGKEL